ncbi:MAG: helix-turn-helix domain-containing protein [Smithella sp.]
MTKKITKEKVVKAIGREQTRKKDKILQDSTEKKSVISLIGEMLKRQRESLKLSQKQISDKLGYPYFNFISMLESGASKIPLGRVADVVEAYSLPPEFIMILTKELHPEVWSVVCKIKESTKAFNTAIVASEIEKNNDRILKQKLKVFRLPTGSI